VITEWLISIAAGIGSFFVGFLPDMSGTNGMIVTAQNSLASVLVGAGALGAWIPWLVLGATFAVVMTTYLAGITLKVVLKLWSFMPFIGGSG
jgi:hypothetical protein